MTKELDHILQLWALYVFTLVVLLSRDTEYPAVQSQPS